DRPDPITGAIVEGPVLDPAINAFTAYLRVPLRHGMTPGELALYHARAKGLKLNPRIIRMSGWKRDMWYEQTGLAWVAPSPNLRTVDAAVLYPGMGCFEASNLSVGRGTAMPFEWLGAPWLDSAALLRELQSGAHPGVEFMAADLTPDGDVYAGQQCRGVKLVVKDRNIFRPLEIFLRLFYALRKTQPSAFVPECRGLERMTGVRGFCALQETSSADTMIEYFRNGAEEFRRARSPFLLY
ncbi:MAG: DUF1343 domain-containing protein, partial [Elusimicrobia bacterium]|nr:DUF1343 domain-containing protein [Elusimicrobiota bacterium]